MRTGRFPFPTPPTDLSRTFARPAADLSDVLPGEQTILRKALSPVPQNRYGSCREMMAYLLRAHGLKAITNDVGAWRIVPEEETVPDAASLPQGSGTISRLRRKLS